MNNELVCALCGEASATKEVKTQKIAYNNGSEILETECEVHVYSCESCELSYTDEEGEDIKESAIKKALEAPYETETFIQAVEVIE